MRKCEYAVNGNIPGGETCHLMGGSFENVNEI